MTALQVLRLVASAVLFALSTLAVLRAPIGLLWYVRVGITEWGHLLAIPALLLLIPGWNGDGQAVAFGLCVAAALLFVSPVLRAIPLAISLPDSMAGAFGTEVLLPPPDRVEPVEPFVRQAYREIDGRELTFDLYRSDAFDGPRPLVVMVHGGSWNAGDSTQLPAINQYLAARGYVVAAPIYRLAPDHTFPAALDDVRACIAHLREHARRYRIDLGRIALMGRSAGGHLALLAAFSDPEIRGVVAYYAPNDMRWSWAHPSNRWVLDSPRLLREFLGGTPDEAPEAYDGASPLRMTDGAPPTLLVHGTTDELVFAEQSRRLDRALGEAGVPRLYIELPWATHGFDANLKGPGGAMAVFAVERFLNHVTRTATRTPTDA